PPGTKRILVLSSPAPFTSGIKKSPAQPLPVNTGNLNSPAAIGPVYVNTLGSSGSLVSGVGLSIFQPAGVASPTIHICAYGVNGLISIFIVSKSSLILYGPGLVICHFKSGPPAGTSCTPVSVIS